MKIYSLKWTEIKKRNELMTIDGTFSYVPYNHYIQPIKTYLSRSVYVVNPQLSEPYLKR